jgi:hypothetical protein
MYLAANITGVVSTGGTAGQLVLLFGLVLQLLQQQQRSPCCRAAAAAAAAMLHRSSIANISMTQVEDRGCWGALSHMLLSYEAGERKMCGVTLVIQSVAVTQWMHLGPVDQAWSVSDALHGVVVLLQHTVHGLFLTLCCMTQWTATAENTWLRTAHSFTVPGVVCVPGGLRSLCLQAHEYSVRRLVKVSRVTWGFSHYLMIDNPH